MALGDCSICAHPDRERIDAALRAGRADRTIAKSFLGGVSHRTALLNHARKHVTGLPRDRRPASRGGRPRKPPTSTLAVAIVPTSPAAVLTEFGVMYVEARDALEKAKTTRDLVRIGKAIDVCLGALDRIARTHGMFSDGTVVNIDNSTKRLELAVSSLSIEELRAFLAGRTDVPALTVVNDDTDVPVLTVVNDTNVTVDQHVERDGDAA